MNNKHILEVRNVCKNFGKFSALKNVNFEIMEGHIVGLLGRNGAGKTTLIKSILGLYKDFEGEIIYQGIPIDTENHQVMNSIGALVDTRFHEDLSAYDNLMLLLMASKVVGNKERKNKINEILELVGLADNAKGKVKSFSMGMKQRLALAQALMADAKLLILDEPFVGLDPLGVELIKNKLLHLCHEENISIIFSSHQLAEVAELSEDIIVINEGKISFNGLYSSLVNDTRTYLIKVDRPITLSEDEVSMIPIKISDNRKEISVRKSDNLLSRTLSALLSSGLDIIDIEVQENALLQLFLETQ